MATTFGRITYASSNDDMQMLAQLGVPLDNIAHRIGRTPDAVHAMLSKDEQED